MEQKKLLKAFIAWLIYLAMIGIVLIVFCFNSTLFYGLPLPALIVCGSIGVIIEFILLINLISKFWNYIDRRYKRTPQSINNSLDNNSEESVVYIYGYSQWFAVDVPVDIYIDNKRIGFVSSIGRTPLPLVCPITHDCEIQFKSLMRSATVNVEAGKKTEIEITWSRMSGALKPQIIER